MSASHSNATTPAVENGDWASKADPFLITPATSPGANRSAGVGQDECDGGRDHDAPVGGLLKFADVPSQLSQLPFNPGSTDPSSTHAPDPNPIPNSSLLTSSSSAIDTTTTFLNSPATTSSTTNTTPAASAAVTPATTTKTTTIALLTDPTPTSPLPPPSGIRKTSPGLAARLKALGFGSQKPSTPPTTPHHLDNIGRLDEEQLRQLDEKHQAGSVKSVIARRGRPWKGAGALSSSKPAAHDPAFDLPPFRVDDNDSIVTLLPEIRTPEPLDMDTQKYRLPDHTNGNGTKVTLDTRREHLERSTCPPSPDDGC
ncbi:hypothetical protein N0V84_009087, partial [Fusarium piperis]